MGEVDHRIVKKPFEEMSGDDYGDIIRHHKIHLDIIQQVNHNVKPERLMTALNDTRVNGCLICLDLLDEVAIRRMEATVPGGIVPEKQERNASCACGSGKKFKKCCGK